MNDQPKITGTSKIVRGIIIMLLGAGLYYYTRQCRDVVVRLEEMSENLGTILGVATCVLGGAGLWVLALGLKEKSDYLAATAPAATDAPPAAPGAHLSANLPSFIASLGMCAAFFMPWLTIFGGISVAGNTLGKLDGQAQMVWAVLILGALAALMHFFKPAKALNVVAGLVPFGVFAYFMSKMGSDMVQAMGIGAWATLVCGLGLILAPVKAVR